jgi:hypothetical protein
MMQSNISERVQKKKKRNQGAKCLFGPLGLQIFEQSIGIQTATSMSNSYTKSSTKSPSTAHDATAAVGPRGRFTTLEIFSKKNGLLPLLEGPSIESKVRIRRLRFASSLPSRARTASLNSSYYLALTASVRSKKKTERHGTQDPCYLHISRTVSTCQTAQLSKQGSTFCNLQLLQGFLASENPTFLAICPGKARI